MGGFCTTKFVVQNLLPYPSVFSSVFLGLFLDIFSIPHRFPQKFLSSLFLSSPDIETAAISGRPFEYQIFEITNFLSFVSAKSGQVGRRLRLAVLVIGKKLGSSGRPGRWSHGTKESQWKKQDHLPISLEDRASRHSLDSFKLALSEAGMYS